MNTVFARFIKFLINRPLLVNLILIFILISSFVAIKSIQIVGMPRVDMYEMQIITTYPGASPEDVELNVTKKIEEAIESVSDIEKYQSQSMENLSVVSIKIDNTCEDLKKVKDDIKDAVDDIADFPEEVEDKPEIYEEKSDNWPIIEVAFYTTDNSKQNYIKVAKELRKELLELPTIAQVDHSGVHESEFHILLDKNKLKDNLISIDEVINAIKSNKIRLSAGSLESYTSETGLVTFSEFSNPKEIGNIIIRINDVGNFIKLRDIAKIKETYKKEDKKFRINGYRGTWLNVIKLGKADILESVDEVKASIAKFRANYPIPENVKIVIQRDQSVDTRNRLYILYSNAIAGLLLVLTVLFLFFNKRIALWTAAGIPIAVGLAFIVTSFLGVTLNSISLLGLVVILGMLVDDSIIIAENIYRYKKKYKKPDEAIIKGLKVVMIPVIASVTTTVIAFIPFYFMPGVEMDFSREIPTFVIAMLIGSLLEALIILPVHLAHDDKNISNKKPLGEGLLNFIEKKYTRFLKGVLNHKYKSLIIIISSFVGAMILAVSIVNYKQFPIDESTFLIISGETKQSSSLKNTSKIARPVEKIIETISPKVLKSYRTVIGQKGQYAIQTLPNIFKFELVFHPASERDMTAENVKDYIFSEIKRKKLKGIEFLDYHIDGGGPPAKKPVEIEIVGNDNKNRIKLIQDVVKYLEELGLKNIDTDYRVGKPEIRITPNYKIISQGMLNVAQVASVIRTAFDGTIVTDLDTADENISFRVMLDKQNINLKRPLDGLYTMNNRGIPIAIEKLVRQQKSKATQTVYRYNGRRNNKIVANLPDNMGIGEVYSKLREKYTDFEKKHIGFKINIGGEAKESSDTQMKMLISVSLAIIAIYFVLVIQFNSLLQPAMVISAIPFGLLGILLAFGLQRLDLSLLALIGVVGYTGVVVNNSLIMVDFINKERSNSSDLKKTIISGASLRLKPIILTTVTTVAGLVPTAYGFFGGYDSFVSPMVMAIAWGLIVGTPSVLIVIPLFYLILEDFRGMFKRT